MISTIQLWYGDDPLPERNKYCVDTVKSFSDEHILYRLPIPEGNLSRWSGYHRLMLLLDNPHAIWVDCDVVVHKKFDFEEGEMYTDFRHGEPHGSILTFGERVDIIKECIDTAESLKLIKGQRLYTAKAIHHLRFKEVSQEYFTHHLYSVNDIISSNINTIK